MKIRINNRPAGSALLLALFTAFIICITLSTYLYLVSNQNQTVLRSMAWNSAIPVVEAGIEEALTQLHFVGITNLVANGWSGLQADGFYHKTNSLGNGFAYDVGIMPPPAGGQDQPTIESVGYSPAPLNLAGYYSTPWGMILGGTLVPQFTPSTPVTKRKVRVLAKRQTPMNYSNLAKGLIDLNGNNVRTDSFDSTSIDASTNKRYDPLKARDHGDVATNSGIVNAVKAGNADIKGHVGTGPNGSVDIGSNGSIGDKAWVESGKTGSEPGWVTDDTNVDIPDVTDLGFDPNGLTTIKNASGGQWPLNTGPAYDYILTAGNNYNIANFTGRIIIVGSGNVKVYVGSSFNLSGQDQIVVSEGTSLQLYVAAPSAKFGGQGLSNMDTDAMSFQYYGLPTNTALTFSANAAFTGTIYAPEADFTLGGGGNNTYDFVGATVTKTLTMTGHFNFHYDESLARRFPIRQYVVFSWNEIDPNGVN